MIHLKAELVVAAYSYDMLGRVVEIDAGTGRVKLTYDYAAQEHNIAGIRFDHRPGTPYNSYGYDDLDRVTQVTYLSIDLAGNKLLSRGYVQ